MATANNLGTAYIRIAPQTEGIQSTIQNAMNKAGSDGGDAFNKGFSLKAGAIAGVVSSVTSKAINAITNQFSSAVTRVDTLRVFPKIMQNLGYETEESTAALNELSTRIEGLPTTLDEIVTYTQRLASSMNSLYKGEVNATDLALAFNDAALAGGKGQYEANRAFEQFVQIMGRGRPMMQDWKIMLEVMPGQLKQMAKYMATNNKSLQDYAKAAGKTADTLDGMDLYEWISADKNAYARERLAEFTKAMITLDKEGGAGIASFRDQTKDATQTIGTALRLIPVRITKALASIIEAFGAGDIYTVLDKFTKSFKTIGDWIVEYIVPPIKQYVIPAIAATLKAIKGFIEYLASPQGQQARIFVISLVATLVTLKTVIPIIAAVKAAIVAFGTSLAGVAAVAGTTGLAITTLVAGVNVFNAATDALIAKIRTSANMSRYSAQQLVNEENALRNLNQARENEASILEELDAKKRLQNDAEYQELQAKQRLADAENALNEIRKDSNATTDQIRIKELELKSAQDAYTDSIEARKKAVAETNRIDKQRYDNMLTGINTQNKLISAQMLEDKQYGALAKRLEELKTKAIEYQNAQGETVRLSKKEMTDLSNWYAESLSKNDAIWKEIVDKAQKEGISFIESARRVGMLAGEDQQKNFAVGIDRYTPYVLEASEASIDKVASQVQRALDAKNNRWQNAINQMTLTGIALIGGLDEGMKSKMGIIDQTLNKLGVSIPASVKKLLGIHSPSKVFMTIGQQVGAGLVEGLDSYEEQIEAKASELATSVVSPFNKQAQIDLGANGSANLNRNPLFSTERYSPGASVVQNNIFNQVADDLDVKEASKLLGFEVATAI